MAATAAAAGEERIFPRQRMRTDGALDHVGVHFDTATYFENLWQTDLHRICRRDGAKGLRRKDLSGPLTPIRLLRNRIAHDELILTWDLPKDHAAMLRITGSLSPLAAPWCRTLGRFDQGDL